MLCEYRVVLPMTVEEYHIGQLYTVAKASKEETGGGSGVEVLANEPFTADTHPPDPPLLRGEPEYTTGQYTQKQYHIANKVYGFIRTIAPPDMLVLREDAWNAYPYCRTILSNKYFREKFILKIESLHVDSEVDLDNVHGLTPTELAKRTVVYIDIADCNESDKDYLPSLDPRLYRSELTNRGPLVPNWWRNGSYSGSIMCAYKLVRCRFKLAFIGSKVEKFIIQQENRLFANFHRQLYCSMDEWIHLKLEDIRKLEESTKKELDEQLRHGDIRGHFVES